MDDNTQGGAWVRLLLSTLTQEGCTRSAALVLAVIADAATNPGAERRTELSRATIARKAGCTTRTVCRSLQQLQALGLIVVEQHDGCPSCYRLTEQVQLPEKKKQQLRNEQLLVSQPRRSKHRSMTAEEVAEMNAYLDLANRFKEDDEA
jgi:DNA-binding HxlR family transcriptional regulator